MRNLLTLILLLILPLAVAQNDILDTEADEVDPGITPDSKLWGIDVTLDRISLIMTRDKVERANKGLLIAQERLAEIKAMGEAGEIGPLEKAQKSHDAFLKGVGDNIDDINDEDDFGELESELELETKLDKHLEDIEKVKKILSESDDETISAMSALLEDQAERTKLKVVAKRKGTKLSIIDETGASESELNSEMERLKYRYKMKIIEEGLKVDIKQEISESDGELEIRIKERYEKSEETESVDSGKKSGDSGSSDDIGDSQSTDTKK